MMLILMKMILNNRLHNRLKHRKAFNLDDLIFINEGSNIDADLDKVNLDDVNFGKDDPETIILQQNGGAWCLPEDEKKGIEPTLTDKNQYEVSR